MVTNEDLKQIIMLNYLSDDMRSRLIPHMEALNFQERQSVFKSGEVADVFFMLKTGKVLLEHRLSDKMTVSVGTIKAGFSFGWSSIIPDERYTLDAVCSEESEVLAISSDMLMGIMDNDHKMGYIIMQRLLRVMQTRLDNRTDQFIRVIAEHPDIHSLIEE
jgi:CRP-like cAMP-binding protein